VNVGGLDSINQYSDSLWVRWSGDQIIAEAGFSTPIQTRQNYRNVTDFSLNSFWI